MMEGLGLNTGGQGPDSDLMRQAENMWKMLDDLAENNPDGYQTFVSSNIEQGKQAMETERESEVKEYTRPLEKSSFKATLQVGFELKPKIDSSELKAPSSVMLNKKLIESKKFHGDMLLSIFSMNDQTSTAPPSLDHYKFKIAGQDIAGSVCVAFSIADAAGLLTAPMSEGARSSLGKTLSRLHGIIPFEVLNTQKAAKMAEKDCIDPNIYICQMNPNEIKRLPGYFDIAKSSEIPKEIVLDGMIMEARQKKASPHEVISKLKIRNPN